jgi:hypothetical protein
MFRALAPVKLLSTIVGPPTVLDNTLPPPPVMVFKKVWLVTTREPLLVGRSSVVRGTDGRAITKPLA